MMSKNTRGFSSLAGCMILAYSLVTSSLPIFCLASSCLRMCLARLQTFQGVETLFSICKHRMTMSSSSFSSSSLTLISLFLLLISFLARNSSHVVRPLNRENPGSIFDTVTRSSLQSVPFLANISSVSFSIPLSPRPYSWLSSLFVITTWKFEGCRRSAVAVKNFSWSSTFATLDPGMPSCVLLKGPLLDHQQQPFHMRCNTMVQHRREFGL